MMLQEEFDKLTVLTAVLKREAIGVHPYSFINYWLPETLDVSKVSVATAVSTHINAQCVSRQIKMNVGVCVIPRNNLH